MIERSDSFLLPPASFEPSALRAAITAAWLADETPAVAALVERAVLPNQTAAAVVAQAAAWVNQVRAVRHQRSALDAFMREYDLSSAEGIALMCVAEALLRIPDAGTAERLIADRLSGADWASHRGRSDSTFVNASTWGLLFTGHILRDAGDAAGGVFSKLLRRSGEPVIRLAIGQAMKLMGEQFVLGRTIDEALKHSIGGRQAGNLHSFDMLGEAALTAADAERYLQDYQQAIAAIGRQVRSRGETSVFRRPSISVKLSALHPRYEFAQRTRVLAELVPRLLLLTKAATDAGIGLCIDAEEADRLELSLDIFERVHGDASLAGWEGLGIVVQAFQKRAPAVIDWLHERASTSGRRLQVRLVKGAYWDTEIKRAQEQGLDGYPVYTRKAHTDVSYLACARRLLASRDVFYPMLATHNAHTIAAVREFAGNEVEGGYEFQRLHGMGEALYAAVQKTVKIPCRVYAPVGSHRELLPYLVRRLLENGANSSFVNQIYDDTVPPQQLAADPVEAARVDKRPAAVGLPVSLYGAERANSRGCNLADGAQLRVLAAAIVAAPAREIASSLLYDGVATGGDLRPVANPADRRRVIGEWRSLSGAKIPAAVGAAVMASDRWSATPVETRAGMLVHAAELLETRRAEFIRLLIEEAGKTLGDAVAEVREAVDFLRYYAMMGQRLMAPSTLPGPTGEYNELQMHGRGVFICISPWNFPLAIFTGQIAAALVTGNPVVAKPAEQTSIIGWKMAALLREAGVPRDVLQCLLGGADLGATLVADPRIAGVVFTGSFPVAQTINRVLALRPGPIATLIAETGGQNAMIVDSSALPEQVVRDAIGSGLLSAGQRCSALRVLFLQQEIADKTLAMLAGAMRELVVGDPRWLSTDIGPVIDTPALERLEAHATEILRSGKRIERAPLGPDCAHGTFFAPLAVEINRMELLSQEHFGPIIHVVRYAATQLDGVIDSINSARYGLTLGVHSRVEKTWRQVQARVRAGNCYINRGMTGAVVGVQPFGGEGLSGTGPKAGGPHYLLRFMNERTLTINTSAIGGNAQLLAGEG